MKQLTLEELKEMSGQPVWCPELETYGIIKCEGVIWKNEPFLCGVHYDPEYGTAIDFECDIQERGLTCYSVVSERDIPKKPVGTDMIFPYNLFAAQKCANCGNPIIGNKIYKYCPECGQKIDWGDGD